jgi:hypothetical protein
VAHVNRTTEPFNTVVEVSEYFNVVDGRTGTYTTKGKAVDFVVSRKLSTTVTDRNVASVHQSCRHQSLPP